jgi:hypothetical protein
LSPSEIKSKIPSDNFPQVWKKLFTVGLKSEHSPSGQGTSLLNGSVTLNASLKSVGLLGSVLKKRKSQFSTALFASHLFPIPCPLISF